MKDVATLDQSAAANEKNSGQRVLLPACGFLDGGVPCISRTPLNSQSSRNIDCVQHQSSDTGVAFEAFRKVSLRHNPRMIVAECVTGLFQRSAPNKRNDSEYIVETLKTQGYWATGTQLQAEEFGSWVPRHRGYWGALLVQGDHDNMNKYFYNLLNSFKTTDAFVADDFIDFTEAQRQATSQRTGVPLLARFGPRESKATKEDSGWKTDHYNIFRANALEWPPNWTSAAKTSPSFIEHNGLYPREQELVYVLDVLFPHPNGDCEFVDVNPVIGRVLSPFLEDGLGPVKEGTSSPWRAKSPTQVGSGTLVMRYRLRGEDALKHAPRQFGIRAVEGYEHMRMSGWDDSFWNCEANISNPMVAEDVFRMMNMAGNSYSIFHWVPWTLCLVSTFGQFAKCEDCEQDAVSAPSASEGDACSIEPLDSDADISSSPQSSLELIGDD